MKGLKHCGGPRRIYYDVGQLTFSVVVQVVSEEKGPLIQSNSSKFVVQSSSALRILPKKCALPAATIVYALNASHIIIPLSCLQQGCLEGTREGDRGQMRRSRGDPYNDPTPYAPLSVVPSTSNENSYLRTAVILLNYMLLI